MHSGSRSFGADTTGSSCQLILAVGFSEQCFGFYCLFRGLNLKYLVFSTFVWPVLLAVILYFLLHINQATISGMCVSEKSEWVCSPEWKVKYCKLSNKSGQVTNKAQFRMKDGKKKNRKLVVVENAN